MSTSEQLERETERERARIAETLDELRAQMTPGHLVDRVVDYASNASGGMFFRNLRQQAVDNPMPVALMGAGLAWLAMAGRRDRSRYRAENPGMRRAEAAASQTASDWSDRAKSTAEELGQRGRDMASNMQDTARETGDSVRDTAASTYAAASGLARDATSSVQDAAHSAADSVAESASATYDAVADQARRAGDRLQRSASSVRDKVTSGGRGLLDFLYEQPLLLMGLGLAIGAAVGAASPSTEVEDELMGESSDAVKERTTDLAKEELAKGQAVAQQAWQGATDEAEKQGLVASPSQGDDGTSHLESPHETPLVPSSGPATSPEDEPTEH